MPDIFYFLFKKDNDEQKLNQKKLAKEVLTRLKKGYDFSLLAEKYSDDKGNASNGGDLGFFSKGKMVLAFEKAAFALKNVGDLSDIVETEFGFHIIELLEENISGNKAKPYEQVKEDLIKVEKDKLISYELSKYFKGFDTNEDSTMFVPAIDSFYDSLKAIVEKDISAKN